MTRKTLLWLSSGDISKHKTLVHSNIMEDNKIESLRNIVCHTQPKCQLMLICQPTNNPITQLYERALKRNVPPYLRKASKLHPFSKEKGAVILKIATSDNCEIINQGCSVHRDQVRIRNNNLRKKTTPNIRQSRMPTSILILKSI